MKKYVVFMFVFAAFSLHAENKHKNAAEERQKKKEKKVNVEPIYTSINPGEAGERENLIDRLLLEVEEWSPMSPVLIGDKNHLDYLHDSRVKEAVQKIAVQLTAAEGPVSADRLAKFIGACFGFDRVVANRISAINSIAFPGQQRDEEGFLFPSGETYFTFKEWRRGNEFSLRHIQDISLSEISNAMRDICRVAQGVRPDCVEILTVHAAKGREWDLVAVGGLQEGLWPNLRQRSSLLGAERLVERERHGNLARTELDVIAAGALLEDERRLLHVATTRARTSMFITCVAHEDDQPSQFFEEITDSILNTSSESLPQYVLPRPITTAALVADLRSSLQSEKATDAAAIIKSLSESGIHSADPQSWTGVAQLSTTEPISPGNAPVAVSPSSAESFTECGMKWFLEKSGGTDGDSIAQVLGSAIHAFAALMVQEEGITEAVLVEKLKKSWNLIDPQEGWVSKTSQEKAIAMITRFMKYHMKHEREVVGVELGFDVTVGKARIRGTVDRLEVDSAGNLFVIDFKTSKTPISYEKAEQNLQLKSYQIAVAEGGFTAQHASTTSSGAALIYLGHDIQKISSREQGVINLEDARAEIENIAQSMGAAQFVAATNSRCKECPVKSSCPIKAEGRTVIE